MKKISQRKRQGWYMFLFSYLGGGVIRVHVWRSEVNFWEPVLSYVGYRE